MIKNKKGFTLAELCIVLAITAVIVTMVCAFLASYSSTTYKLESRSDEMRDLTDIQAQITSWINRFDSSYYTISVTSTGLSAGQSTLASEKSITVTPSVLTFSGTDGTLSATGGVAINVSYESIATVSFSFAKNQSVGDDGTVTELATDNTRLIICDVTTNEGKAQKYLFTLQSQTTRNRYSSGNRLDIAKVETATKSWIEANNSTTIEVTTAGALKAGTQQLSYATVDGAKRLVSKSGNYTKKYYGLVAATNVTYAIATVDSQRKITCTITFGSGDSATTETLEWIL